MKILGIDYGDVRTGVAISDALGILGIEPRKNRLFLKRVRRKFERIQVRKRQRVPVPFGRFRHDCTFRQ